MFIDMLGKKRYKLNLHTHTKISDGKATPEEAAEIYKKNGYDAIALTDHWIFGEEKEISGLKIIPGCEYDFGRDTTAERIYHILDLFGKNDPGVLRTDGPAETVKKISASGGLPVLAHPAWSLNQPNEIKEIDGIEFIEIYNTVSGVHNSARPYAGMIIDLYACLGGRAGLLASDDTHFYDGDEAYAATMVEADSLSDADLIKALRAGKFYATTGPEIHISAKDGKVEVLSSPCSEIKIYSNVPHPTGHHVVGENITRVEADYDERIQFLRAEATDKNGRTAYSTIISLK